MQAWAFKTGGGGVSSEKIKGLIEGALKRVFRPEFLNRVDDVVFFQPLEKEHIFEIIDLQLDKVFLRINGMGYNVKLTEKAKEYIAEKGYDQQFGARPLNRAIQKYLEDPIADEMLKGLNEGDTLHADFDEKSEEIKIKVKKSRKKKTDSAADKGKVKGAENAENKESGAKKSDDSDEVKK